MDSELRPRTAGRRATDNDDAADLRAVSRTLRGDTDAFREIVDRHGSLVLRLSTALLRDPEEAEEACQEVFFKAFRSLRSFNLEKAFVPWLYTLAMNYLRSRYGSTKRRRERVIALVRDVPSGASGDDPSFLAEKAEERERLHAAMMTLPPSIREVVSMYYDGQMSVSQVAEILGIGTENVKSRLHRGRKALRESLDHRATTGAPERYNGVSEKGRTPA